MTGVAVSPDGDNVYTSGAPNDDANGSIAEFSRGDGGALTPDRLPRDSGGRRRRACGSAATGRRSASRGLVISPDGNNVYTASRVRAAARSRSSPATPDGSLTQLAAPNDCIQEQDSGDFGCGTDGTGIGSGYELG